MTRRDYERVIARMAKRIVSLEKKNEKLKTLCTKLEEENIELGEKLIWQEEYHKEELALKAQLSEKKLKDAYEEEDRLRAELARIRRAW